MYVYGFKFFIFLAPLAYRIEFLSSDFKTKDQYLPLIKVNLTAFFYLKLDALVCLMGYNTEL